MNKRYVFLASVVAAVIGTVVGISMFPAAEAHNAAPPSYSLDTMNVYDDNTTTLGAGTPICTGVSLTVASSCSGTLTTGTTYRFEFVMSNNSADSNGTPNQLQLQSVVAASDVIGSSPTYGSAGCDANTNWTQTTSSTNDNVDAGNTCNVLKGGGTATYWAIITIGSDAGSNTATFFITDGTNIDTSTTTTFTVSNATPTYIVDLLTVYESESTTLNTGNLICQNVDLEASPSSCTGVLEVGHTYRFQIVVRNDGTGAGSPTTITMNSAVGINDVLGSVTADAYNFKESGCNTNTNWTESIVTSTDARGTSGTTCSISSGGGTATYWLVSRVRADANSGTSTFTISGPSSSDVSTTTTFTVNNIVSNGGGIF